MDRMVRLCNAIKDAVTEMDRCPDDSIQDIWNEMLDKWETGLRMDHNHNIEPNNWNDAALIAAAPDLLAALKGIMSNFQLRNIGHGGRMDAAVDAARAAIAKAEGA